VEPVFGRIKSIPGYRRFLLRGLKKAQGQWSLICAAVNLRRVTLADEIPRIRGTPREDASRTARRVLP